MESTNEPKMALATTTFDKFKSMEDMARFGEQIVKSQLCSLKKPEDVVAAILAGKEMGLGVMVSINNIYPINGKPTAGIHIISAMLLKAGIITEIVRDYEPVFQTYFKSEAKDGNKEELIPIRQIFLDEKVEEGEGRGKKPVDYKTVVRFTRMLKQPDTTYSKMTITSSFSYGEALTAGLLVKDNWKNHLKTMVRTRALAIGSKIIGDDIILGLYETSEMADMHDVDYEVIGDTTVIKSKESQNKDNKSSLENIEEAQVEVTK